MDGLIPYVLISTLDIMVEMRGSEQRKIPACKECHQVAAGTSVDIQADAIRSPFSVSSTAGGQILVISANFLQLFPCDELAGIAFGRVHRNGRPIPDIHVANVPTRLVIRGAAKSRDIPRWSPRFSLCRTCGAVLHHNRNGRLAIDSLHAFGLAGLKPALQPGLAVSAGDLLIRKDLFPAEGIQLTRNERATEIPFSSVHADGLTMPWEHVGS